MSNKKESEDDFDPSQFDWLQLKREIGGPVETQSEKMVRKFKENPVVPIGSLVTIACLSYGLYSFRTGKKKMSQLMMRSRVAAQGLTFFALIAGLGFGFHGK